MLGLTPDVRKEGHHGRVALRQMHKSKDVHALLFIHPLTQVSDIPVWKDRVLCLDEKLPFHPQDHQRLDALTAQVISQRQAGTAELRLTHLHQLDHMANVEVHALDHCTLLAGLQRCVCVIKGMRQEHVGTM